jgi:hypothetical protein
MASGARIVQRTGLANDVAECMVGEARVARAWETDVQNMPQLWTITRRQPIRRCAASAPI